MLCLWLASLSLDGLSVNTLSDMYVGGTSSFSSALHYNTTIIQIHITQVYQYLHYPNHTHPPLPCPTPFLLDPLPIFLTSYIKMCNFFFTLTTCIMVLICT